MQEIHCTVNSCYYYETDDRCAAERIIVRNNPSGLRNAGMEVGELGHLPDARESQQTMCETFVPKARGPKAGINRIQLPTR